MKTYLLTVRPGKKPRFVVYDGDHIIISKRCQTRDDVIHAWESTIGPIQVLTQIMGFLSKSQALDYINTARSKVDSPLLKASIFNS